MRQQMSPGGSSTSSAKSGSHSNFAYQQLSNNMLIANKRNNLRELVEEDLGLIKPPPN